MYYKFYLLPLSTKVMVVLEGGALSPWLTSWEPAALDLQQKMAMHIPPAVRIPIANRTPSIIPATVASLLKIHIPISENQPYFNRYRGTESEG